jgi:hypothetical protein
LYLYFCFNIKSSFTLVLRWCFSKLQSDDCFQQIMVTVDICFLVYSYIVQWPSPCLINNDDLFGFEVFPFGDLQVSLWMFLCRKMVPPMVQLLFKQKSINRSPLPFLVPQPFSPITLSTSCVVVTYLDIQIAHYQQHVMQVNFWHCL